MSYHLMGLGDAVDVGVEAGKKCLSDSHLTKDELVQCAKAAAAAAAAAYCTGEFGPEAGSLCGMIASELVGKIAPLVYDAGKLLVDKATAIVEGVFASSSRCGCGTCINGKCWADYSAHEQAQFCVGFGQPPLNMDLYAGKQPTCQALIDNELITPQQRLDAVMRVNSAYQLFVQAMAKIGRDQVMPLAQKLGVHLEYDLGDERVIDFLVSLYNRPATASSEMYRMTGGSPQTITGSKTVNPFGWFARTGWDAPLKIAVVQADPNAIHRANDWAVQLKYACGKVQQILMADAIELAAKQSAVVQAKALTLISEQLGPEAAKKYATATPAERAKMLAEAARAATGGDSSGLLWLAGGAAVIAGGWWLYKKRR